MALTGYGNRIQGILFDDKTLLSVSRILDKHHVYKSDHKNFYADLLELSNFCELFCLYDDLHQSSQSGYRGQFHEKKEFFLEDFSFNNQIKNLILLSIDDIQLDRVFDRWTQSQLSSDHYNAYKLFSNPQNELTLSYYKGSLYEELTGINFFPSTQSLSDYIGQTPVFNDAVTYNLLVEAYWRLSKSEARQEQLRDLLRGYQLIAIPPILKLILSNIDHVSQFDEELQAWRDRFNALRKKIKELNLLAASEESTGKVIKEYKKINDSIDFLLKEYGVANKQMQIQKTNPEDSLELGLELSSSANDEDAKDPLKFGLNGMAVLRLSRERLLYYLRRRRIQPLPDIKKDLSQLKGFRSKFTSIWGIDLNELSKNVPAIRNPIDELHAENSKRTKLLSRTFYYNSFNQFRKDDELKYLLPFDISDIFSRFALEFPIRKTILQRRESKDYSKLDYQLDLGYSLLKANDLTKAALHFSNALDIDASNYEAYHGLSMVYVEAQIYNRALQYIENASELKPDYDAILNDHGTILMKSKKYAEAQKILLQAVKANANNAEANLNLASVYFLQGFIDKAKDQYQVCINKQFGVAESYYGLAIIEEQSANWENASVLLSMAFECDPDNADYFKQLLMCLFKAGRMQEFDKFTNSTFERARQLFKEGKITIAYALFKVLNEMKLLPPKFLYGLGVTLDEKEDYNNANFFYKLELVHNENDTQSLTNLAMNFFTIKDYEKSIKYAKRSRELDPYDSINLNCLAVNYYKLNKLKEAREMYEGIVQLHKEGHAVNAELLDNAYENIKSLSEELQHTNET